MNKVNYGLPYVHTISLRLTHKQYESLCQLADINNITISDFIRLYIDLMIVKNKGVDYENEKSNFDN